MKKLLLTITILMLMMSVGYSKEQPLQLTIKSDKGVYEVGEEIELEATIKNNSDKEMIVFWNNAKPSLLQEEIGVITAVMPSKPAGSIETVYIKPRGLLVRKVVIENTLTPLDFPHRLTLQYNFPAIDLDLITKPNQRVFTSTLTSNTITIEVVEKFISKEEALSIAKEHCKSFVPTDAPVDIELQGKIYIVTFKIPEEEKKVPQGYRWRGPDYQAQTTIDATSGEVLKVLGGS